MLAFSEHEEVTTMNIECDSAENDQMIRSAECLSTEAEVIDPNLSSVHEAVKTPELSSPSTVSEVGNTPSFRDDDLTEQKVGRFTFLFVCFVLIVFC